MFRQLRSRAARLCWRAAAWLDPSGRGAALYAPGDFYSPLLDLAALERDPDAFLAGAKRGWECIDLRPDAQRELLAKFLTLENPLPLAAEPAPPRRYGWNNPFFLFTDAWALARLLGVVRPRRVIEVGSGWSSAVMLDARDHFGLEDTEWTFIEPYPARLESLLRPEDRRAVTLRAEPVQRVPDEVFADLAAGDVLFIDSSHVGKVGSDLADLLVRVLPRLAPGVWIHFHDVAYPGPYPPAWLREGRAWNEVLFIQTLLLGGSRFQVEWFNAQAGRLFHDQLAPLHPTRDRWGGGSLWLRTSG
ncbi:MAG: class I SAM-dependent methyltransferase [Chthoniobacteraceae bacterium]